jgi:hypothetical protein
MLVESDICLMKQNVQALMMAADRLEPNPNKPTIDRQDRLKKSIAGEIRLNAYSTLQGLINMRKWIHNAKEKRVGNKVNRHRRDAKRSNLGEETRANAIHQGEIHGSHKWEKARTIALGVGAVLIFIVLLSSPDRQPHSPTDVLANIRRATRETEHQDLDPILATDLVELHITADAVTSEEVGFKPKLLYVTFWVRNEGQALRPGVRMRPWCAYEARCAHEAPVCV